MTWRRRRGGTTPSLYTARRWKPPRLPQKIIDMTRPITPTTMRITPTVWMLNPGVLTLTAKSRIAPTAIRKRLVPRPIPPSLVSQVLYALCTREVAASTVVLSGRFLDVLWTPRVVAQVDDPLADGDGDRLEFRMCAELREDGLHVLANGVDREEELVCHRGVLRALGQEVQDLPLTVRERRADSPVVPSQLRQQAGQHGR